jgi:hypothetical protein
VQHEFDNKDECGAGLNLKEQAQKGAVDLRCRPLPGMRCLGSLSTKQFDHNGLIERAVLRLT